MRNGGCNIIRVSSRRYSLVESPKVICAVDRKRSLTGNGGSVTAPPTLTRPTESYYVLCVPGVRAKTATAITIINTGHSIPHADARQNFGRVL